MSSHDLPATILRLPAVYGEGDYQHRLAWSCGAWTTAARPSCWTSGSRRWRWTRAYVENAAAAIALAATDERAAGRVYNVGDDALSYADWVRAIGRAAGWQGEVIVAARGPPAEAAPAAAPATTRQHLVADTTRIRQELGYAEPVSREEGLRRAIEWERANRAELSPQLFDYAAEDALLASLSVMLSARRAGGLIAVPGPALLHTGMCRSIKRLRKRNDIASHEEIAAAALQFVRKISGYRQPSRANEGRSTAPSMTSPTPRTACSQRSRSSVSFCDPERAADRLRRMRTRWRTRRPVGRYSLPRSLAA